MNKKALKGAAVVAVLGAVFQFGGCLGGNWWKQTLWTTVGYSGLEFVLDNDTVFDVFEDDGNNLAGL